MTPAERWLRERVAEAPPRLMETMVEALPAGVERVPDALAGGALVLYRAVIAGTGGREDALPLLAADALLTHAFEAQAELDPAGAREFAARWGGEAGLGRLAGEVAA